MIADCRHRAVLMMSFTALSELAEMFVPSVLRVNKKSVKKAATSAQLS